MTVCRQCSRPVSLDEIGLNKKLINRGVSEYFCWDCLSSHFNLDRQSLHAMVERFRASGCMLFSGGASRPSVSGGR